MTNPEDIEELVGSLKEWILMPDLTINLAELVDEIEEAIIALQELAYMKRQEAQIAEYAGLLTTAKCPNCDGSGSYASYNYNGDVYQAECQWCAECQRIAGEGE